MMDGQAASLGCAVDEASCLCANPNFRNGINDCALQACGAAVAPTVSNYAVAFCASKLGLKLRANRDLRAALTWDSCNSGAGLNHGPDDKPHRHGDNALSYDLTFADYLRTSRVVELHQRRGAVAGQDHARRDLNHREPSSCGTGAVIDRAHCKLSVRHSLAIRPNTVL